MDRHEDIVSAEHEIYYPSPEVVEQAYIKDYDAIREKALADIEAFWAERAQELDWFEPWEKVLDDSNAPFYQWFVGAKTNIVYNALDRHVTTWRKNKIALIWEGENGDQRACSYYRLWQEVNKFANILRSLGVKKGDTVTIYMGRITELPIAMLATAKIGAIHSVVYGGFSEQALADRIRDAQSRVLITADGAWLRGKTVNLKDIADAAVHRSPVVEHMVVVKRTGQEVNMEQGRDFW
jgi:acetyl-CoA synthetase